MQQVWRKRSVSIFWFALGAITLVLLASAVNKKNQKVLRNIEVTFSGDKNNFFIDEKGIEDVLKHNGLHIRQPLQDINLQALESVLMNDDWVASAQLFFDNRQVLQVVVEEKIPVARIFTAGGSSFYIDSACKKLPLSYRHSARITMFTNFTSDRYPLSKPDSFLMASIRELARFIEADEFWKAQVAQVDITPEGFVMVPTVGNHTVELGNGDWQQKFDRLYSFYKQVWTKVGFEKYSKIDVQFSGQVVATVRDIKTVTGDTAKARMAFEALYDSKIKSGKDSIAVAALTNEDENTVGKPKENLLEKASF